MIRSFHWIFTALLVVLLPRASWGTAQTPDWLLYHGDTLRLYSNPLEQWLEHLPQRPAELRGNSSTACWRGYKATWQLENDRLYLVAIKPCGGRPIALAVLQQWFPLDDPQRIAATWVTGQLDVVLGKLLRYEHLGYESIYEQDWLLRFEQGKLVGQHTFNNQGCQAPQPPGGAGSFAQRPLLGGTYRCKGQNQKNACSSNFAPIAPAAAATWCCERAVANPTIRWR